MFLVLGFLIVQTLFQLNNQVFKTYKVAEVTKGPQIMIF